ncbi:hypothetical protein EIN_095120 [Entamoeba invadens IP1]|uniref:N-acetyltransferase domain-containing protein n=1 Tax=Entamoeba invadens IP1 TaxID=370355 RepID=A0A0A1U057_ENTIV|nr:hypothetical protein EIN_095120 [Entamoeba invadens IP1]ELP87275.1 hypothetical protein EIN_095120 [Entamoeba invadens IP1]|eukprot:XP_004254046.1 hypothetical protein EIN_095120 [Entamoeba invadens IP1]
MQTTIITRESIPLLQSLAKQTFYATYTENLLSNEARDPIYKYLYSTEAIQSAMDKGSQFTVYYENEKVIGFTGIRYHEGDKSIYLHDFYLMPELKGKGLGSILMGKVKTFAHDKNCNKIILNCNINNERAIGFYNKHNFKIERYLHTPVNGFDLLDMEMECNI